MILVVSLSILLICLIVKRSKFWGGLLLIWLWILFGWSSENADYLNLFISIKISIYYREILNLYIIKSLKLQEI